MHKAGSLVSPRENSRVSNTFEPVVVKPVNVVTMLLRIRRNVVDLDPSVLSSLRGDRLPLRTWILALADELLRFAERAVPGHVNSRQLA